MHFAHEHLKHAEAIKHSLVPMLQDYEAGAVDDTTAPVRDAWYRMPPLASLWGTPGHWGDSGTAEGNEDW